MTDHWMDEPDRYVRRDDPRCRRHPHEYRDNCRCCRSEQLADHDNEPENIFVRTPEPGTSLADVIPINRRPT